MHEKNYVKYVCDYCGKEFDAKLWCEQHQKEQHLCHLCKHHYIVYCSELECALKEKGQSCNFEPIQQEWK